MPDPTLRYRIDPDRCLAFASVHGEATGADIAACVRRLRADPAWSDTYDVIWDERGVTTLDLTPDGLDRMVEAQTSGQVGLDVVISDRGSREAVYDLYARRTRAQGRPTCVCTTMECALEAVGLSELPTTLRAA